MVTHWYHTLGRLRCISRCYKPVSFPKEAFLLVAIVGTVHHFSVTLAAVPRPLWHQAGLSHHSRASCSRARAHIARPSSSCHRRRKACATKWTQAASPLVLRIAIIPAIDSRTQWHLGSAVKWLGPPVHAQDGRRSCPGLARLHASETPTGECCTLMLAAMTVGRGIGPDG